MRRRPALPAIRNASMWVKKDPMTAAAHEGITADFRVALQTRGEWMRVSAIIRSLHAFIAATLVLYITSSAALAQQTVDLRQLDFATLQQRANANDSDAQAELGDRYLRGSSVPQDYALATSWHFKAAQQGNVMAKFHLGFAYLEGHGVAKDAARGLALWREAADQGSAYTENWLGYAYENGFNDVPKDLAEARRWYQRAASHGDEHAQGAVERVNRQLQYQASSTIWADRQLPDIAKTLDEASKTRVAFTPEEMQKLATRGYSKDDLNLANKDKVGDSASKSLAIAEAAQQIFGTQDARVEILYQRACALPYDETRFTNFCERLGRFYESVGAPKMALEVYTLASKCKADLGGSATSGPPCFMRAAAVYRRVGETSNARLAYQQICTSYSIPSACEEFKELGGTVDMDAVETAYRENRQDEKDQRQKDAEDRAGHLRENDARYDTVVSALQGMSGGSDQNAIINAGNQQAAAIRAIGDANAVRQRQDAQLRLSSQQMTPQTSGETPKLGAGSVTTYTGVQPGSAVPSGAQPNASNTAVVAGPVGSSAVQYTTPLATSCVRQFWDTNTYNWLSFENDCGQAIYVSYIPHTPGGWAMGGGMHLQPGSYSNTGLSSDNVNKAGGMGIYVCPTDSVPVDLNGNALNTNVAEYRCKPQ
jgi:TPR repeat protein